MNVLNNRDVGWIGRNSAATASSRLTVATHSHAAGTHRPPFRSQRNQFNSQRR